MEDHLERIDPIRRWEVDLMPVEFAAFLPAASSAWLGEVPSVPEAWPCDNRRRWDRFG